MNINLQTILESQTSLQELWKIGVLLLTSNYHKRLVLSINDNKIRQTQYLFNPNVTTQNVEQAIAATISHEVAHMWFGNIVSPLWYILYFQLKFQVIEILFLTPGGMIYG